MPAELQFEPVDVKAEPCDVFDNQSVQPDHEDNTDSGSVLGVKPEPT